MSHGGPKFIWQKWVTTDWLQKHEASLSEKTGGTHATIESPKAARLRLEFFCETAAIADELKRAFGGTIRRLANDWQAHWFAAHRTKPLRIGGRLVVRDQVDHADELPSLIIPASAAFGTGEHATTAMSLRMLERVTRRRANGWRMLDAGTGSGILALAARRFGADEVVAIDNDPTAIHVAMGNARANGIPGVQFVAAEVSDAIRGRFDIIAANLYAEVLRELLPRFRAHLAADGALILSGVMRSQESTLLRDLCRHSFAIKEIRRRGKWIALLLTQREKRG